MKWRDRRDSAHPANKERETAAAVAHRTQAADK
jgi:hypothetical protein